MSFKFNPTTSQLDLVGSSGSGPTPIDYGVKYNYHLASLSAYDRVASISYLDAGLRTQRINTVTLSSAVFPDADIIKPIFYLDVGSIDQRIDKIEYVGAVFSPDSLRKQFSYSLAGIKYKCDGFTYELF